jgi:anti-sigma regulatory factor (Ser/Thr protein kinase)
LLRQATLRSQLNKLKKQQNVSPSESRQLQIAVLEAELNQR